MVLWDCKVRWNCPCAKLINHYTMKTFWKWMYTSTISWPSTSWRWLVIFTLRPLYPQRYSQQYPLDRRLCRPHSQWDDMKKRTFLTLQEPNSNPSVIQPVALLTFHFLVTEYNERFGSQELHDTKRFLCSTAMCLVFVRVNILWNWRLMLSDV
jgi:hypothetical protein